MLLRAFLLPLFALVLNVVTSIVLASASRVSALHAMYAVFNLILGCSAGLWAFMCGYKGMATGCVPDRRAPQARFCVP